MFFLILSFIALVHPAIVQVFVVNRREDFSARNTLYNLPRNRMKQLPHLKMTIMLVLQGHSCHSIEWRGFLTRQSPPQRAFFQTNVTSSSSVPTARLFTLLFIINYITFSTNRAKFLYCNLF